jgi:membrane protein
MHIREIWHVTRQTVEDWFEDSAPRHGAAIAYYTLFALAPVLVVVIAIAGLVFGEDAVRGEIVAQLAGLVGRDGAQAIQGMLLRARASQDGTWATIIGVAGLLFATTGAFLELQAALNRVWRVEPAPGPTIDVRGLLLRRLRSLGVVVAIGFLLMVTLSVNAAVGALADWWLRYTPGWPVIIGILNQAVSIGVSTLLFSVLFRVLPDVELSWRDVGVGALVTAILFAIGQRLIGLYLGQSSLASPFGAAGTIAIILVWVYYAAQIVLLGAAFTRVSAERRRGRATPMPGAVHAAVAAD